MRGNFPQEEKKADPFSIRRKVCVEIASTSYEKDAPCDPIAHPMQHAQVTHGRKFRRLSFHDPFAFLFDGWVHDHFLLLKAYQTNVTAMLRKLSGKGMLTNLGGKHEPTI